ncbi:MAG: DUF934 domain-containing protein [Candidatus Devosia symbiotica]|nr:DUF934 domain-containing protein [Candidatus Devosia symbiotica]
MADPFHAWNEESNLATASYTHVPLAMFVVNRDAILANPHSLGLSVAPEKRIEDVAADLGRFVSIAIAFPAFTDGRGYSLARMLVERYQYTNEIRAVGNVLQDQIPLMRRCGINALVVTHEPTRAALAENRLPEVAIFINRLALPKCRLAPTPFFVVSPDISEAQALWLRLCLLDFLQ